VVNRNLPHQQADEFLLIRLREFRYGRWEHLHRVGNQACIGYDLLLVEDVDLQFLAFHFDIPSFGRQAFSVGQDHSDYDESALADDAKALLAYLRRVGHASPDEISRFTELSRSTVTRRLRELFGQGRVRRTGKTKAVRYSAGGEPVNDGCTGTATQELAGLTENRDENVAT